MLTPPTSSAPTRRRRRRFLPISIRRSLFEWVAILLLMSGSTIGVLLFGAVRNWFAGGLMVLVFLGIAMYFARPMLNREARDLRIPPGGIPFIFFALYTAILIPFVSIPYEAKVELLKIGSYLGAYWAWTELASRYGRRKVLLWFVMTTATLVAIYAVVQHFRGSTGVLNMTRDEGYGMRASGTFMAPAHFGAYMAMIIPLALSLVFMPSAGAFLRLFSGYGLVFFLPALILSGSRSGWIGCLVGLSVVTTLLAARRGIKRLILGWALLLLVVGALGAAFWFSSPQFKERLESGARLEGTAAWRLGAWADTWEMIQDAPVFGHGPGSYRWMYPPYQSSWTGFRWLRFAHNEYLHLWAEYGAVGVLLMAGLILAVMVVGLRLYVKAFQDRDPHLLVGFLGMFFASLGHAVSDFNYHVFALMHLLVMVGGITFAGLYRENGLTLRPLPLRAWIAISSVGLGLSALGMIVALQVAVSGAIVRLAEDRVENVDLRKPSPYAAIERDLQRAIRIDPGNWMPYLEVGNIYRRRAFWVRDPEYRAELAESAYKYYRKAYERNPYDMNVVYGIARSYFLKGDHETSYIYLRRTVDHWPANIFYTRQLGIQLRADGRFEEALAVFIEARRHGGWDDPVITGNIRWLQQQIQLQSQETAP